MRDSLLSVLAILSAITSSGAIFDFTPLNGNVSAVYVGGASGNVQISISGANGISVPTGNTQAPLVNSGIVAWSSSSKVYYYVFDPALGQWKGGSQDVPAFAQDLSVMDGVVAWSTSGPSAAAFCRVYDPSRRNWISGGGAGAIRNSAILNKHGVVVWNTATTVQYQVYDPTRTGWMAGSATFPAGKDPSDLVTSDGVVAWSISTGNTTSGVNYRVYDPQIGLWVAEGTANGSTTGLTINNGSVFWSTSAGDNFRGYNGESRHWQSGSPVPVPYFAVSTNAGNQPLIVNFIDMSLAGTSWSWNFGDGSTSTRRSPTYRYTTFGRLNATLKVNGTEANFNRTILTDITLPTGTLTINDGIGFATNRNVTLALTATDNSSVTAMRFDNEGGDWSDWETFATTKDWLLNTNNGSRTVSAQFRDVALNTSATVTATIQLDTTPIPTITFVSTNTTEDAGVVTVVAALDRTYSRPVVVSYITTNGTAVAGQDFDEKLGTLTFPVGTTTQPIPITIRQDTLIELNETFSIHFGAISNVVVGTPELITILDDDTATVSFAQPEYSAVESNGAAAIVVRLDGASGKTVSVRYLATNGTATADLDYTPVTGELIFPPGVTNQTFIVPLINDNLDEFSETVNLQLFAATNAALSISPTAMLTIIDDDKPVVFFTQASYPAYESNNISSAVQVSVRLSKPYTEEVNVECAVQGVTASPGDDYDQPAVNIPLRYLAGQTNKDITIIVRPDTIQEGQETIRLTLTEFVGGSPGPITTALIVITDDDSAPFMQNTTVGTNGLFSTTFVGFPDQVFTVECTTNFVNWVQLARLTNSTGTLDYSQPIPLSPGGQFYRTRLIP